MTKRTHHRRRHPVVLTALTWRPTSPRPKASCARRRSAARKWSCRRSCSRASISRRKQDPKWFETAKPAREHPSVLALQKLAKELEASSFPSPSSRRTARAITTAWRSPMPTARSSGSIARATSPTAQAIRRNIISAPATPASRRGRRKHGTIGVGICWDQWYPEAARAMMLQGAEILFYPTAIGSEPYDLSLDTHARWQRAMQGHAVANAVPVVAANRIGVEQNDGATQSYYGHSFIADHTGELVASFGDKEEGVLVAQLRSRRDRALPRRMGLLPRPPHRPLRQEHRVKAGADAIWLA